MYGCDLVCVLINDLVCALINAPHESDGCIAFIMKVMAACFHNECLEAPHSSLRDLTVPNPQF